MIGSVAASLAADLACLSARFSFKDFPDFLDMACRGDLSDIAGPLFCGGLVGPDHQIIRHKMAVLPHRGGPGVYRESVGNPATPGCVSRLDR